jgi:hypothetical protein
MSFHPVILPDDNIWTVGQLFCAGRMMSIVGKIVDMRPAPANAPACRLASAEGWC